MDGRIEQLIDEGIVRVWAPRAENAVRVADPCLSDRTRERLDDATAATAGALDPALRARVDELRLRVDGDGSVHISGPLAPGERIYGAYDADSAGLQRRGDHVHLGNELHVRGRHETLPPCERCTGHDPDADLSCVGRYGELHLPVLVSSAGYGIYISNATTGAVLDLGGADPDRWSYDAPGGEADVYLLGPGTPREVLQLYMRLTGHQPLPPTWTLGFLQSRFGYESFDHALRTVRGFRERQLPVHGLVFDVQWLEEFVNLRWDPEHFPDPERNLAAIADHGVRTVVITEPGTRADAGNYPAGAAAGHFAVEADGTIADSNQWYAARGFGSYMPVEPGPGAFVNFFADDAADWWYGQHLALLDQGVDAWWLDLNEPEDFRDETRFPHVDWPQPLDHLPGDQARNVYALAQQRAFTRGDTTHSDRRPFLLSRSGASGSQRYGAAPWSGDIGANWDELRLQPQLMLTAAMCGIPLYGFDVGGFHGEPSPELFARWMQMGAFVPVFRAHGARADREPWAKGEEALEQIRPALNLRAQLLPSIATWMRDALAAGLPLARPMLLDHPDDDRFWNCSDQWMFGPLLVAPVLHPGATTRTVHLPPGEWVELWSGAAMAGGTTVELPVDADTMPVLLPRTTALVVDPAPLAGRGRAWPPEELEVWSFAEPGAVAETTLWIDDGITRAHLDGEFGHHRITVEGDRIGTERIAGSWQLPPLRLAQPHPGRVRTDAVVSA